MPATDGKERDYPFFEPDEYTAVNARYFADLRRSGAVSMDLSGWVETLSDAAQIGVSPGSPLPFGRYYMDEGSALGAVRVQLHQLLSVWEGFNFDPSRFTVCPSVGTASLLTMAVLRRKGIRRIFIETPCYFAAILQAEWLGYEVVLIPTYFRDGYIRPEAYERPSKTLPSAWWLTQPRVTLGFNQELESLKRLLGRIGRNDYVVVDEALDQSFPSAFGRMHHAASAEVHLIRLKGFGKPIGLNGYRLAFVLHPSGLRSEMIDCLETFGGAVDAHSLATACAVAKDPRHMEMLMNVANRQVVALRIAAERIATGSHVQINPLQNGYLGSAIVNLKALGRNQKTRRHRFLIGCQSHGMPVIIGPSMHFASDPPTEAVRINFFSRKEDIVRGVSALGEIASGAI